MLALSGIVWMIVSWSFNHSWSLLQSIPGTVTRSAPGAIAQSAVGGESPTTFASMAVPVTEPANATVTEVNSLERVTAIAEEAGLPADEGIEAVQIDLKALLQDPDTPTDTNTAFTTLFRIWNLSEQYRPGMLACDQAAEAGLRCWHDKGTWNNLRSFNRPAVIELVDSSGTRHHLVVSRLEEKMATLNIAGRELDFPLSDIDRYWFGEYLLLWRAPPLIVRVIHLGMRGKAVQWLQDQLDELDGQSPSTHASDVFGPELEARVRAFQRKYRLKEDGVVGEQTLICLSTALNHTATPLLWRPVL
jgi:Putative peptidoglycan-binding domain-containing protein